jgi:hypothetical protein
MDKKQKEQVKDYIDSLGVDYTFVFNPFKTIEDRKFHQLRENFLKSRKELLKHIEYGKNQDT